ncbi:MAG: Coenzyme F420 hydrogenase/dehydrogenase, beta subunit C-terminal domain [Dehalococcoidales bacterium]|nr:Coenzyme F420 hydrogenase/dehydrogenase, beta subunit C-terminal domain [Dehalococcoidales bacterium]MDZ4230635.1 Coenzyme F420 hydrogenase/dehydrogenase, beta subunit C-terminal domain [Dehalococcoidales bacterium]
MERRNTTAMNGAKASRELFKEVIELELCPQCGGCTGGCPYLVPYKGRIVLMDACNLNDGQCYEYCPRTHTDLEAINQKVFGVPYGASEIGVFKDIFLAHSADAQIHEKGQDGGTVTTLLSVALDEGMLDAVVETKLDADKRPHGFLARNKQDLLDCAGVSYEPSPVLETLNRLPKNSAEKLGMVGVPCQIACLRKMQLDPPRNRVDVNNVKLAIGLFCGWTLAHGFHEFMHEHFDLAQATKFDVPHHPAHTYDVYTDSGIQSVEIDDIGPYINHACSYCFDMTAEFSDISVGSGRAAFKGWNTVVVRSQAGAELVEKAKAKGALVTQPIPEDSVINLKRASLNKKKRTISNLTAMSGDKDDLGYLEVSQEFITRFLA